GDGSAEPGDPGGVEPGAVRCVARAPGPPHPRLADGAPRGQRPGPGWLPGGAPGGPARPLSGVAGPSPARPGSQAVHRRLRRDAVLRAGRRRISSCALLPGAAIDRVRAELRRSDHDLELPLPDLAPPPLRGWTAQAR